MGELKSQLEAGTDDPAVLAEYNKLAAEKNGETVPPTESEKVQQDMQAVIDRVVEQGDATTDDWADMAELYHRGTALNVDTTNLRREAATRLMESVKDPNKLLKMKELMATKEIQDMIQEVTSLTLQNRNLPRIQKETVSTQKTETAPQDDRSQKMEAYKAKLAKGEKITADENAEYQKLAKAEVLS